MRFEIPFGDKFEKKRAKNFVFVNNFHLGRCVEKTCKNRPKMKAFYMRFETVCEDKFEKNMLKTTFLSENFTSVNKCKTRGKTVLKSIRSAFVLRDFVEASFQKHAKNDVFMINFYIGKSVQNKGKNRLEMKAYCMRFETLCGDKFEKKKTSKKLRFCE